MTAINKQRYVYRDGEVLRAAVDEAVAGNNTLVAAVTGKRIRVLSLYLHSTGANIFSLESSTTSAIMPLVSKPALGDLVLPHNPEGWFDTVEGELLNLTMTQSAQVSGVINYIYV